MAKSLKAFSFFAIFLIFFLLATSSAYADTPTTTAETTTATSETDATVTAAKYKLCERRSKTWSGLCLSSRNCDRKCRTWERAKHGACHGPFLRWACYCYFKC